MANPNPIRDEIGAALEQLEPGLYRSTFNVCRVRVDPATQLEVASEVLISHCRDFIVRPAAPAPAALPPAGEQS